MPVEFDHLFLCASPGAEEESKCLATFGLTEGNANAHPGQGTACRRFFFANCYLELLWVCSAEEAQQEIARPTYLWERWERRARGVCPFGLGFRPRVQHEGSAPFSCWEYCPAYLPAPLKIYVAANSHVLTEPMLFHLPFALRPDSYPSHQSFSHRADLREVTRVEFLSPRVDSLSREMEVVTAADLCRLRVGSEYLVELGFDGELRGEQADFRPLLPLRFCW